MRRLIGSIVTLTFFGFLMMQSNMLGGGSGGGFAQSSGPKRIVINQDNAGARPMSGHRFVSARMGESDAPRSLPQTWSLGESSAGTGGFGGGLDSGISGGNHLPANVQAQLDQISNVDTSGLRGHAMGGSLNGFVSGLNAEMESLLSNIDPSGGAATMIACWLPGRSEICNR